MPTGLNNVMITAVPNDGRNVVGGDGQTRNVNDIKLPKSSLWSTLKSGLARGIANLLSNVTNTAAERVERRQGRGQLRSATRPARWATR